VCYLQDISDIQMPDDYPFPESVLGRGLDYRYAVLCPIFVEMLNSERRACWFIAMEVGVSSIPVSEVSSV
jgi:kynurenine aminotransferase